MQLRICITSDVHGKWDHYLEIAKKMKALKPDLIIDNGDFLQGSLTSYYYENIVQKQHPMIDAANELGVDVAIFGNHEFNYAPKDVEAMRNACQFPWIACNVGDFAKPFFTKIINGKKIAIVGAVTHATPRWDEQHYTAHMHFEDAYASAKKWVDYVKKHEQPDYIILSYHGGFTTCPDTRTFFAVDDGENQGNQMLTIEDVDLFITGHQHLEIFTAVNGKPVIQPGANGFGFVEATIDLSSKEATVTYHRINKSNDFPVEVKDWLDEKIGFCKEDCTYNGLLQSRLQNNPFADLIHDVQLNITGAQISIVDLSYYECGGFTGTITNHDLLEIFSRPNLLTVVTMTGAELHEFAEQCAATFALHPNGALDFTFNVHPNGPHPYLYYFIGGVKLEMDIRRPVGQRVTTLHFENSPIQDTQIFTVAMNTYLATGADFPFLKGRKKQWTSNNILPEIVRKYIQQNSPLQIVQRGQLSVVYPSKNTINT